MKEALEKLYREHRQGLYSYALSLTHSPQMAEDAIQTGFLGIIKSCERRERKLEFENLVAYAFRSVRNAAMDLGRTSVRQKEFSDSLFQMFQPADDSRIPIDQVLTEERDKVLREAIDQLDEKHQEAIVLKLFAGLTFEQAGETTGCSPKTIATRYRRALDKLQNNLKGKL